MSDLLERLAASPLFWMFFAGLNAGAVLNSIRDSAPWWWLLLNIAAVCWCADKTIKTRRAEVRP